MRRRSFLHSALGASAALLARDGAALGASTRAILDAHIHLFDPTRPGGVPWPEPGDPIRQPALPSRYRRVVAGTGVVGAIAVEASPLRADNDWLLGVVQANPIMVGMVGDLVPDAPEFAADLRRLRQSPLFLGIRYGNLWKRDLAVDLARPGFSEGLRLLADAGLVLESANPTPALLRALAGVAGRLPSLTIVVDHLPQLTAPADAAERRGYEITLDELAHAPRVFVKLSEILRAGSDGHPLPPAAYRETLDALWQRFGAERLLFGSDWPNSDHLATYAEGLTVMTDYLRDKGAAAQAEVLGATSLRAYRLKARTAAQRALIKR